MIDRHRDLERIRTAYHEAGHAVVSNHHGWQVGRVSIVPNASTGDWGHMQPKRGHVPIMAPENAAIDIQICVAGPLAEAIHRHGHSRVETQRTDWATCKARDIARAYLRAKTVVHNYNERAAYLDGQAAATQELLSRLWPNVELLAEQLLQVEILEGIALLRAL
ncbi:MAG TPA: hypothetical protein VGG64_21095 [Pirellulales bacterium]|jgi:hypothetical protein